jgi:hypothetical protein
LLHVLLDIDFIEVKVQKDRKSVIGEQDGGEGKRGGGGGGGGRGGGEGSFLIYSFIRGCFGLDCVVNRRLRENSFGCK